MAIKKQVEYLQRLFYDLWNDFGNAYLLVKYSRNTIIGTRGFSEEEMKQGIVLVFNNKTNNALQWDDEGNLTCILAFGNRKEELFIHNDDMLAVFSPEAGVQYLRNDTVKAPAASPYEDTGPGDKKQVVSINNYKKQRSKPQF